MRVLKAGALYFTLVFAAGFVLGPVRELWAVPRFGATAAELMEMPLMLAAIVLVARWTVRRLAVPPAPSARLGMGLIALGLLLAAELVLVGRLRGLSVTEYLAGKESVAGAVYVLALGLFAVMPALVGPRRSAGATSKPARRSPRPA